MYPYKHIPDGLRFRCAKYRKKSKDRCTHKVNLPFPGEKAFKVSTDPIDDLDNQLVERFFWNKMAYSKDTVTLALFFAEVVGLPANTTSFILSYLFQVGASHDTITRWRKKAALAWHKKLGALKLPSTSTLHFDETGFKEKGRKVWLWLGYEESFCSLQGWHFSHRRATQFARNTLARVKVPPEKLSESKIVTDGLYSYQSALGDLPCFSSAYHHIFSDFREEINNNVLERKYGSLKDLARRFRGFKSRLGLWSFVTGQVYLDTYFWPKEKLAGLAPAERTGLKLPEFKQRWKWLCRYLT
jgi:transposase-like protein